MPEGGLSTAEVGNKISEHAEQSSESERREWVIAVVEAALLAIVAVLAAFSGYASAKWSTESRIDLAKASTLRTEAATDELAAMSQRNFDSSTFESWFVAWVAGNASKEAVAERRFTPNFRNAFNAWMATNPETNPNAPPGPTYMPEYKQPKAVQAAALNQQATALFNQGTTAADHSDDYVRVTVYLATVLFLLALSGHFRIRSIRIALVAVSGLALVLSLIDLASLPRPHF